MSPEAVVVVDAGPKGPAWTMALAIVVVRSRSGGGWMDVFNTMTEEDGEFLNAYSTAP